MEYKPTICLKSASNCQKQQVIYNHSWKYLTCEPYWQKTTGYLQPQLEIFNLWALLAKKISFASEETSSLYRHISQYFTMILKSTWNILEMLDSNSGPAALCQNASESLHIWAIWANGRWANDRKYNKTMLYILYHVGRCPFFLESFFIRQYQWQTFSGWTLLAGDILLAPSLEQKHSLY